MLWLIYSDLLGAKKVILGYLGVIIMFNLFISNIFGLIPLAMLVIKGMFAVCLKDDYSNGTILYGILPHKRSLYVIEKHILAILLLVIGLISWFFTSAISISNPILLGIEEMLYLCIFVIIIICFNEVYLYFVVKNGALQANSAMRPYLIVNAVIIIVLVKITNENLKKEIIEIFTKNYVIITMIIIFLLILGFSIGLYLSIKEYERKNI
jgi:hypothetical protein